MTLDGYMAKIACPALLAAGEYDPRGPLDEVYRMFDPLTASAELWSKRLMQMLRSIWRKIRTLAFTMQHAACYADAPSEGS